MFRSHFRGLKWIVIWFIPLLLLLCVVLLVLSIFAYFDLQAQNMWIKYYFKALWIKDDTKRGPKTPNTDKSWQVPRSRKSKRRNDKAKWSKAWPATTTGYHGGAHEMAVAFSTPRFPFFLCSVLFPNVWCVMFLWFWI